MCGFVPSQKFSVEVLENVVHSNCMGMFMWQSQVKSNIISLHILTVLSCSKCYSAELLLKGGAQRSLALQWLKMWCNRNACGCMCGSPRYMYVEIEHNSVAFFIPCYCVRSAIAQNFC